MQFHTFYCDTGHDWNCRKMTKTCQKNIRWTNLIFPHLANKVLRKFWFAKRRIKQNHQVDLEQRNVRLICILQFWWKSCFGSGKLRTGSPKEPCFTVLFHRWTVWIHLQHSKTLAFTGIQARSTWSTNIVFSYGMWSSGISTAQSMLTRIWELFKATLINKPQNSGQRVQLTRTKTNRSGSWFFSSFPNSNGYWIYPIISGEYTVWPSNCGLSHPIFL